MTGFWEICLRATILWAAGEAAACGLALRSRRASCVLRAAVAAGMLALPVLGMLLPRVPFAVPGWKMPAAAPPGDAMFTLEPGLPAAAARPVSSSRIPWLPLAWMGVAAIFLLRMGTGAVRLRRLLRTSRQEEIPEAFELAARLGLDPGRVRVLSSPRVTIPFTAGVRRPVVLLPGDWRSWPAAKLRSVPAHELAHAAGKDWLAARLAAVNRAFYWFHPAAWWLERRLAAEAEWCADEKALAVLEDRQAYVEAILDFARVLRARRLHGLEATAMARSSRTGKRLERILAAAKFSPQTLTKGALAALLAAFAPAVLAAALALPVPQPPEPAPTTETPYLIQLVPSSRALNSEQEAAAAEARLAADPEDDESRIRLLAYYVNRGDIPRARVHAMHLIEQRPETPQAALATHFWDSLARRGLATEDIQHLVQIWKNHLATRPPSARLLGNAASVMMQAGLLFDAESLLQRARRLEPAEVHHTADLARLYASAVSGLAPAGADFRAKAYSELASTADPLLLAYAAESLLRHQQQSAGSSRTAPEFDASHSVKEAESLLRRALQIDPGNEVAKNVMAIYESRLKGEAEPSAAPPRRITVAGGVQQAMLIYRPAPEYPEAAQSGGIEGSVRFAAVIATDGTVKTLTLLSGHPSLVKTALEAVQKYRYRPTLLNGEPVEVETVIEVPFRLAPDKPLEDQKSPAAIPVQAADRPPVPIYRTEPGLTPEARAARVNGKVLLEIEVNEEGTVRVVRVVQGLGYGLDEKAVEAVSRWKFQPGMRGGKPVAVRANVEVNFTVM